ncbi:MAG: Ty1/Copia family ribonuclease HI, partial [Rickettsia endosymbiont of Ixodes persulcatus]|nr:Ty1/Copia family ribonuclease HI [Rickettsia endosymbiont of Ixodes persulcatus]
NAPGIKHYEAAVQVFRYLKYSREFGLKIKKNMNSFNTLEAYTDADWANCEDSRKSVSGYLVFWNGNVISWKSKKQSTISLSSTEAEYKSIGDVTKEIMWIKILLNKIFNIRLNEPTVINEDNQGAIDLANNETNHNNFKTKHMALRYHFIRNEINLKNIKLKYVRTISNLADFLTKSVGKTSILRALKSINQ